MKNKNIITRFSLLLIICLMSFSKQLYAIDVNSESLLRTAISDNNSYIRLTGDIALSSTLTISSGNRTIDLNGKTISFTKNKAEAKCIVINGGNTTFTGSGAISAITTGSEVFNNRNAIALSYDGGLVHLCNVMIKAQASDGTAYTLDPNNGYTVGNMIPAGAYMTNSSDYGSTGLATTNTTVSLITHNVTYNTNGGSPQPSGLSYTLETTGFSLPGDVARSGYQLKEWQYKGATVNPSVLPVTSERTSSVVMTFDALWLDLYTITYNLNGGTNPGTPLTAYTVETETITLPVPVRTGYRFMGWYEAADFSGNIITTQPKGTTGNKTYYARWSQIFNISYTLYDGSFSASDYPQQYITEEETTLPVPVKADNQFRGWFDNDTFNGSAYDKIAIGTTGDQSFFAKWLQSFSIEYILNGGKPLTDALTSYTEESETYTLPVAERTGYNFKGWFGNADFTGSAITSVIQGSSGNKQFFAGWTPTEYKLNYVLNGGSNPEGVAVVYTIEDAMTLPQPVREHYSFAGWYATESLTGKPVSSIETGTTGDKTYYAAWEALSYTISFVTNGGTSQADLDYTVESETFDLPVRTKRDGYTFAGWYDDQALTKPHTAAVDKGSSGDFMLYANWTLTSYSIAYDCYHGTNPADAPGRYTTEDEVLLPVPLRSGFTFAGWHLSDMLDDEVQGYIAKGSLGDKKFYASWTSGNRVEVVRPVGGSIRIMQGTNVISSGQSVGAGVELTISAEATGAHSAFEKLVINGEVYTTSPQTIKMPAAGGLSVSALFSDPRPLQAKPFIITDPLNTDYIPNGSSVWVTLKDTTQADTLFYSIDGAAPRRYTQPFQVATVTDTVKTVMVQAIARKADMQDGIATRAITFRPGKITITFDLPKGITAHNPEGGEVVSAVATGGTFEFKLVVDKGYYPSVIGMKVMVGDIWIIPNLYGVYTLPDQTGDVTVKVSGLSGVTRTVSLKQTTNGQIFFTEDESVAPKTFNPGEYVSLTAEAYEGYRLLSWEDGSTDNPRILLVESDTLIEARFIQQDPGYGIVLPEIEGVTVCPLTGYYTEVKEGGNFKCYLRAETGYSISSARVYANGELLEPVGDVYSLFNIRTNIIIAVDGVQKNKISVTVPERVSAHSLQTGLAIRTDSLYPGDLVRVYAVAPEGQRFSKWNDGKTDNPRIVMAEDVSQQHPLFLAAPADQVHTLALPVQPGAGLALVSADASAVAHEADVRIKLVLLPHYSQSTLVLKANGTPVTQDLQLRASTDTQTFFYTLRGVTEDTEIVLEGLTLNSYTIALQQTEGGSVSASQTGLLPYGTQLTLSALPANGKIFMKWSNGQTLNPFTYTVTGDATLSARFISLDIPLSNENIGRGSDKIYAVQNQLYVETSEATTLSIWELSGRLYRQVSLGAGSFAYTLPAGQYIVRLGADNAVKIIIR